LEEKKKKHFLPLATASKLNNNFADYESYQQTLFSKIESAVLAVAYVCVSLLPDGLFIATDSRLLLNRHKQPSAAPIQKWTSSRRYSTRTVRWLDAVEEVLKTTEIRN
jgi:hypothetical protein